MENNKELAPINISLPTELITAMDTHIAGKYNSRSAFIAELIRQKIEKQGA